MCCCVVFTVVLALPVLQRQFGTAADAVELCCVAYGGGPSRHFEQVDGCHWQVVGPPAPFVHVCCDADFGVGEKITMFIKKHLPGPVEVGRVRQSSASPAQGGQVTEGIIRGRRLLLSHGSSMNTLDLLWRNICWSYLKSTQKSRMGHMSCTRAELVGC